MNKKYIYIGIVVVILVLLVLVSRNFIQHYRPFSLNYDLRDNPEEKCVTYYKDCICFGVVTIQERYPPGYGCTGFKFCRDINVVECQ